MDQVFPTEQVSGSHTRETPKRDHDFPDGDRPPQSLQVNEDSLYLNEYIKKIPMPRLLKVFRERIGNPERKKAVYDLLRAQKKPFQAVYIQPTLNNPIGKIFSNVLLAAYIPTLKRDGISYSLYVPRFLDGIPMYTFEGASPDYDTFRTVLRQWIIKFEAFVSSTEIVRSGLLISLKLDLDLKLSDVEGHQLFLSAEKKGDNKVIYIVDNISYSHYTKQKPINVHDFIKTVFSDYPSVFSIHNESPVQNEVSYTCMSCARRAAIYAAIVKQFANSGIRNEAHEPDLCEYHYRHYLYNMHKMFRWFDSTEEFWGPPYWTLWSAEDYFGYNEKNSKRSDWIVELTSDLAYVNILKEGKMVKLWFHDAESPAFVENKERGGCITSGYFRPLNQLKL